MSSVELWDDYGVCEQIRWEVRGFILLWGEWSQKKRSRLILFDCILIIWSFDCIFFHPGLGRKHLAKTKVNLKLYIWCIILISLFYIDWEKVFTCGGTVHKYESKQKIKVLQTFAHNAHITSFYFEMYPISSIPFLFSVLQQVSFSFFYISNRSCMNPLSPVWTSG